ncbi:MAG: gliding motility-associated C-terminal domain-containing protein, partial [Cytophagales bacterium]|nr:gliding motility-associated C-terminal domain-containing protein [Cytophagales bacterium]
TDNLIPNGNFELGNQGFTNDYILHDTGSFKSDQYIITPNPRNHTSAFVPKKDHTSGTGNMLLADGSLDTSSIDAVYRVSVPVEAGKTYFFTSWMANIHREFLKPSPDSLLATPANFGFFIDSASIGQYKLPTDTAWYSFSYSWTPSTSKTITLEIKDLNTKKKGNDFVIDDISLTTNFTKQASISVLPCNHKLVFSPDGDGNSDTYFIEDAGPAKIFDLDGNLVRELQAPTHWDGLKNNGSPAATGYYAIVIGSTKSVRISLIR